MRPKLVLAISMLALGTALSGVPALAQNSGPPSGNIQQNSGCPAYFETSCSSSPYATAQPKATEQRRSRTMERSQARNVAPGYVYTPGYGYNGRDRRYYDYAGANFAGPMRSDVAAACAARFRSYDPATGTYMGFDGVRHPCP